MPCADMKVENSVYGKTELASDHEKHSHDTANDLCSPFCVCNCCGSQMTSFSQSVIIEFPICLEEIKTQLPTYKSIFTSNFYGSIWQPPQIA